MKRLFQVSFSSPLIIAAKIIIIHHHSTVFIMMPSKKNFLKRIIFLCVFIFIIFPLLSIFLATIFGGLLAWAENAKFIHGFLYVVSNLLGMANPLTDWVPTTGLGAVVVIDIYTAVAALISFGIMLNVVNLFRIPHEINNLIRMVVTNEVLVPTVRDLHSCFVSSQTDNIYLTCNCSSSI